MVLLELMQVVTTISALQLGEFFSPLMLVRSGPRYSTGQISSKDSVVFSKLRPILLGHQRGYICSVPVAYIYFTFRIWLVPSIL